MIEHGTLGMRGIFLFSMLYALCPDHLQSHQDTEKALSALKGSHAHI